MSTPNNKTAVIKVHVTAFMPDSEKIPKLIELFDKSLKVMWKKWYQINKFSIVDLEAGTYTLRLSLSSGIQKDETFDIEDGEIKQVEFNISYNSPHETHEWAYLNKSFTIEALRDTNLKNTDYYKYPGKQVNGKLWKYSYGNWEQEILPQFMNQTVYEDGNIFNYNTKKQISFLEISGEDMPNLYVSLPPANNIKCLVKLAERTSENIYPIDVTVSTDHFKAETLLTLLTNGAIGEAKTLTNAEEAEELLYQKMLNPVTAAIGGYFLLKTGELERLHDWANNLANWFPWLSDGAIIHATQLLNKKEKTFKDIMLIRKRLLQAANEGIPVYYEGLRLLDKGLTQLWYYFKQKDEEINKAYIKIGKYMEVTNFTKETTTFIGISPSEPGRTQPNTIKTKDSYDILQKKDDIYGYSVINDEDII